jgi:NAD(P)-dependent dehydrogenase (short-subunit alcohol dehydrogenase family)
MRTLAELMDLTGRQALLTGGAGQLALAVGEALVELGATVAVADLDASACAERARVLSHHGKGRAWPLPVDLLDERATRAAVQDVLRAEGSLAILIHCAAYGGTTTVPGWAVPFAEQTVKAWDDALRVNLTAAFVLAQEASEALARSGHGSVILFSSIYGMVGPDMSLYASTSMANPVGYGASKGGVMQLTHYLATILGPKVRCNALSPGGVFAHQPEAFVRRYEARVPLKRMAEPEDLKGAVAFLASDLSAYVTGQNLVVDGGWTAW